MGKYLLILFLLLPTAAFSQDNAPKPLFADVIGQNIKKYKKKAKYAYRKKEFNRAQFLFDSLVDHVIKDSYMNNFKVRKVTGRTTEMYKFEKPVYLITSAFWVATSSGEIPALNTIADRYHDQVDIVVLFWGPREAIVKLKKHYSRNITLLYVDELENTNDFTIKSMKHSLGFPTTFIMDESKRILDVRRNINHRYEKDYTTSYNEHYQTFMNGLSLILNKDKTEKIGLMRNQ
ncbi:MAG: TlpA family protein disulfide reductase [Bacteroidia bacterium]|nr:TlpA family protein disulfide reductase [Bacteroidia bacterium]NNF31181.1 TlpA family protein disulfide reductase [Flavobacteriaceae bacterium]MBT8274827.1 TlpA family protein disulfide reductase [Bacteroidia bacterium]NNJ81375.1 TlpA family protein disulfide reductase [Flavobacteriaceae bacterium]NNK54611.1 TlpA family protein disulfide reductase [Flavobacteriaceae bacterium]